MSKEHLLHQSRSEHSPTLRTQVVTGERVQLGQSSAPGVSQWLARANLTGYLFATGSVAVATLLTYLLNWHGDPEILIAIYLLGMVYVATRCDRGPAILSVVLSALSFDYFFVPPFFSVFTHSVRSAFTVLGMFVVSCVVTEIAVRARQRTVLAHEKEARADAQYCLSRDLSTATETEEMVAATLEHIGKITPCSICILLPNLESGSLSLVQPQSRQPLERAELDAARLAYESASVVKPKTGEGSTSSGLYLPLSGSGKVVAVMGLFPDSKGHSPGKTELELILSFANQFAITLERSLFFQANQEANLRVEKERFRNALLSSVSHDLRTPLSSITGAASSLSISYGTMSPEAAGELIQSISDQATRLNRLVANLLDMSKLHSGMIEARRGWHSLEEVVGAAINHMEMVLKGRKVTVSLPDDLPLVSLDPMLIEQVLVNLIDNAVKYAPAEDPIAVSASIKGGSLRVEVFNTGSHIADGDEAKVFDKFYRGLDAVKGSGAGLGLAICKGFVEAHGGEIWAENRDSEGVAFVFTVPLEPGAPMVDPEIVSNIEGQGEDISCRSE